MKKFNLQKTIMVIAIMVTAVSCNKNQDKMETTASDPAKLTESMMSENGANPDEASITTMMNSGTTEARMDGNRNTGHFLYTESNETGVNSILSYEIKYDGSLQWSSSTASGGVGTGAPLGSQGALASNAEMGASGAGTGTSYIVENNGSVKDINGARPDYQSAPCWVATTKYGRFAYMTNNGTNNISSYYIAPWGGLYLVESNAGTTGGKPLDVVVAANNYFVYTLNSGTNNISGFHRMFFGKLTSLGTSNNLPKPATGLATF